MDITVLPFKLPTLLQFSHQTIQISTASSSSRGNGDREFDQNAERFKKLIEGIRFSRSFIVTYQYVLLGLLTLLTAKYWLGRYQARGRRRANTAKSRPQAECNERGKDSFEVKTRGLRSASSQASNSSSTIHENHVCEVPNFPILPDEESPLLVRQIPVGRSQLQVTIAKVKAWLVYQPNTLPVVNKALPSNGTSLIILALLALQAFYLLFHIEFSVDLLFVFADRASLLFVANLPLLYLLAAKNAPIKVLTGYSYESVNIFHRRLGEVMCLLALMHSLGMIGVWYTVLRPTGISLIQFLLMKIILLGIGAFVAYENVYFTSLGSFRRRWYELFLGVHVILQMLALVFLFFHHSGSRPYVGAALGIFLIDRLFYRMTVRLRTIRASLHVMDDGKTVSVCAILNKSKSQTWLRALGSDVSRGWKATEHIFLTIPALARKHTIQAHPFTIASPAPQPNDDKMTVRMIIRAQDGFSSDLLRYAKNHASTMVRLDGPYGSRSAVDLVQDSDNAILIAGGSGIAVIWPLLSKLMTDAQSQTDTESCDPLRSRTSILFVWIVRESSHVSWIGEAKINEARKQGVEVIMPPPTTKAGHPDISAIVNSCIARDEGSGKRGWGVVCSGPDSMNRSVRNACSRFIGQGQNVSVNVEKFGW